jgi:hypothetical protein
MLKEIMAISGQPGLYKVVSKGNNSLIVESLVTGKRMLAHSANKITSMADIAIFTITGEVSLKDVLKKIEELEVTQPIVSPKATPVELKKFFKQVLADYDEERVYVSDIKKVISWYLLMKEKGELIFEEDTDEVTKDDTGENTSEKE